jgi:hypothetical protein
MSIAGSKLTGANALAPAAYDPILMSVQAAACTAGLAVLWKHTHLGTSTRFSVGLATGAGVTATIGVRYVDTSIYWRSYGGTMKLVGDTSSGETKIAAIYRYGGGALYALKQNAGVWNLGLVTHGPVSAANLYAAISAESATYKVYAKVDDLTVALLGVPFVTRFGLSTAWISNAPIGTTISHETSGQAIAELVPVVGNLHDLMFRRVDDDNCWIVRLDYSTNYVRLIERNAGVEVERASTTVSAQSGTWSLAAKFMGNYLYAIAHRPNGTMYCTTYYNSTLFNTATSAKLRNFASSDFASFPYTLPSDAVEELEKYLP